MYRYVINTRTQSNDEHEIHNITVGCPYLPPETHRLDLGLHPDCNSALSEARRNWPPRRINGCPWCARECHRVLAQ